MRIYGEETKLYNVKIYHNGKSYGYILENVLFYHAEKFIMEHQGKNGWECFIEEAKETENK